MSGKHLARRRRQRDKSTKLNADLLDSDHEEDQQRHPMLSPDSQWKEIRLRNHLRMRMREGKTKKSLWVDKLGRPVTLAERILRFRLNKEGGNEITMSNDKAEEMPETSEERPRKQNLSSLLEEYIKQREGEMAVTNQLLQEVKDARSSLHQNEHLQAFSSAKGRRSTSTISLGDSATNFYAKSKAIEGGSASDGHNPLQYWDTNETLVSHDDIHEFLVSQGHLTDVASQGRGSQFLRARADGRQGFLDAERPPHESISKLSGSSHAGHRPDDGTFRGDVDFEKLHHARRVSVLSARFSRVVLEEVKTKSGKKPVSHVEDASVRTEIISQGTLADDGDGINKRDDERSECVHSVSDSYNEQLKTAQTSSESYSSHTQCHDRSLHEQESRIRRLSDGQRITWTVEEANSGSDRLRRAGKVKTNTGYIHSIDEAKDSYRKMENGGKSECRKVDCNIIGREVHSDVMSSDLGRSKVQQNLSGDHSVARNDLLTLTETFYQQGRPRDDAHIPLNCPGTADEKLASDRSTAESKSLVASARDHIRKPWAGLLDSRVSSAPKTSFLPEISLGSAATKRHKDITVITPEIQHSPPDHRIYDFIGFGHERPYSLPELITPHSARVSAMPDKFHRRYHGDVNTTVSQKRRSPPPSEATLEECSSFSPDIRITNGITSQNHFPASGFFTPTPSCLPWLPSEGVAQGVSVCGKLSAREETRAALALWKNVVDTSARQQSTFTQSSADGHAMPTDSHDSRDSRVVGLYNELKTYSAFCSRPSDVTIAMSSRHGRLDMRIEWGFLPREMPPRLPRLSREGIKNNRSPGRDVESFRGEDTVTCQGEQERKPEAAQKSVTPAGSPSDRDNKKMRRHCVQAKDFIYLRELSVSRFIQTAASRKELNKFLSPFLQQESGSATAETAVHLPSQHMFKGVGVQLPRIIQLQNHPRPPHIQPRHLNCFPLYGNPATESRDSRQLIWTRQKHLESPSRGRGAQKRLRALVDLKRRVRFSTT